MAVAHRGAPRVARMARRLGAPRAGGGDGGSTTRRAPSLRSVARPCSRTVQRPCAPRHTDDASVAPHRNARAACDGGEERAAASAAAVRRPVGAAPAAPRAVARLGGLGGAAAAGGAEAREPASCAGPPGLPRSICRVELVGGDGGGACGDAMFAAQESVVPRQARPCGGLLELAGKR